MTYARPMFPPAAGLAHASAACSLAPVPPGSPEQPTAAWQAAVIRLAASTERLTGQLAQLMGAPVVTPPEVRDLVEGLIDWLDQVDADPDLEATGDDEPSLGSHEAEPAGAVLYVPSWTRVAGVDVEGDQCDDEGVR